MDRATIWGSTGIDDIVRAINNCSIRMFADDTCIFLALDNRDDIAMQINEDLQHISEWARTWLVNFSPSKTKEMVISNKDNPQEHPQIVFNDHIIERVTTH